MLLERKLLTLLQNSGNFLVKPDYVIMQKKLDKLKRDHRKLDNTISKLYSSYIDSTQLYRLKTKKLWIKDEIYRIERLLKEEHGKRL